MHFRGTRSALGLVPGSDGQEALGVHVRGPGSHPPGEGAQGIWQPPARGVPKFWSCLWVGTRHWQEEELTMPGGGRWLMLPPTPLQPPRGLVSPSLSPRCLPQAGVTLPLFFLSTI